MQAHLKNNLKDWESAFRQIEFWSTNEDIKKNRLINNPLNINDFFIVKIY